MWDELGKAMIYDQVLIYKTLAEQAAFDSPSNTSRELLMAAARLRAVNYADQYTYMPYTGVDDRNGTAIYVNDYIDIVHPYWQCTFVVKQERGAYVLHNPKLPNLRQFPDISGHLRVVGNVYQDAAIQLIKTLN